MTQHNGTSVVQRHELEEILSRLDWVDEERRKMSKRATELEQIVQRHERELEARDQRLREIEERLADVAIQIGRAAQFDPKLQQLKEELLVLLDQTEQRQRQAASEAERLRRAEQEGQAREVADIRKKLPEIGRLRTDMELRQAEEARLSQLIGKLQTRFPPLENRLENWERELSFTNDRERQWAKQMADLNTALTDIKRRVEPLFSRLDIVNSDALKIETKVQELANGQAETRQTMKQWIDQIQLGEYERNQRVENWQNQIETYEEQLTQFTRDWVTFSDQYKEAQMAVDAISDWQRQFEQQQGEISEISRVEIGRMQSRWDSFLADYEKRWNTFQTEQTQHAANFQRRDSQNEEQIAELRQLVERLQAEKEALWRVQTAQLDAVKNFPRIWLEEVEKARERDPNRRRQPALVPVDDDVL